MRTPLTAILATSAVMAVALSVRSGLQPGEMATAFEPHHVTGPEKGTDTCMVCKYPFNPTVVVWVTGDTNANIGPIAKRLESHIARLNASRGPRERFKAYFVFVEKSGRAPTARLTSLAEANGLQNVSLTWVPASEPAVKDYKIDVSPATKNTVLVYEKRKVTANFVNVTGDARSLAKLDRAIAAVTTKK
jgi:protocatechuate 3,4-dioxygenase beta subunit